MNTHRILFAPLSGVRCWHLGHSTARSTTFSHISTYYTIYFSSSSFFRNRLRSSFRKREANREHSEPRIRAANWSGRPDTRTEITDLISHLSGDYIGTDIIEKEEEKNEQLKPIYTLDYFSLYLGSVQREYYNTPSQISWSEIGKKKKSGRVGREQAAATVQQLAQLVS